MSWIRGLEETCCWGKQFNRVYQQLVWEIAVRVAHGKPLPIEKLQGTNNRLLER